MSKIDDAVATLVNLCETFQRHKNGELFNSWKFGSVAQSTPIVNLRVAKVNAEALDNAKNQDNPSEIVGTALFACPHCDSAHEISVNVAQLLSGIIGSFQFSCTPNGSTHVAFGVIVENPKRGEKK